MRTTRVQRPTMPELRGRVRRRTSRLRAGAWTVAQTTLAVGAAWTIATAVNDRPFFAPIAAMISLGAARGRRRRQAVELSLGVAVGIAIADLIVVQLARGRSC